MAAIGNWLGRFQNIGYVTIASAHDVYALNDLMGPLGTNDSVFSLFSPWLYRILTKTAAYDIGEAVSECRRRLQHLVASLMDAKKKCTSASSKPNQHPINTHSPTQMHIRVQIHPVHPIVPS
jgi:hypothetical protein